MAKQTNLFKFFSSTSESEISEIPATETETQKVLGNKCTCLYQVINLSIMNAMLFVEPLSAENDDIDEIIEMHVDVDPTDGTHKLIHVLQSRHGIMSRESRCMHDVKSGLMLAPPVFKWFLCL